MQTKMASFKKGCFGTVLALIFLMILGIGADQIGAQEPVGSLSGRVTRDADGAGINGVRIDIYSTSWSLIKNAWTDSSGNYTAGGLPAGSYYLVTLNGQGYIDEYYSNVIKAGSSWPPAGVTAVNVIIGSDTPNINFGLSVGGSISGRVVKDSNGAGIQNVEIDVYDENWRYLNSTFTDSSGNYTMRGLPGGIPTGSYYLATLNQQGYADEYYNNITKAGSLWPPTGATAVNVINGSDTPNINFGLAWGGSISGRVVRDSDGTGIQNVEVDVYDNQWNRLNSTFTDSSGNYTMGGLATGSYYLATLNQQGYIDEYYSNITKAGSSWPPAGATPVSVIAFFDTPNINFGLSEGGSISGRVAKDSGTGIQNVEIDVYNNNWNYLKSAFTDSSGNYTAGGLPAGQYYLRTLNHLGYIDAYYNNVANSGSATLVSVPAGSITPNINFVLAKSGSISGRVVKDSNGTGIKGVQVSVYNGSWNLIQQGITDSSGNYVVGGLPTGSSYVETLNQEGYVDEYYDNATSSGGATGVSVTAGFNTPNINFSLALSGSISGVVVRDSDGTRIQNVSVSIYNSGWNYVMNVWTDSFGNYTVGGLVAGNYYAGTGNDVGYLDEYYDNIIKAGGSWPPAGAMVVSVAAGSDTPNINFSLALSGSISGRVTRDFDGAGIRSAQVRAYDTSWNAVQSGSTDLLGDYTISGLLAGNYYLLTSNSQGYINEYYNNTLSAATATLVSVAAGSNTPNINLSLAIASGGSISGRVVKDSDGTGIANVKIDLYSTSWNHLGVTALTNSSGNYTVGGLLGGSYYVGTWNQQGYADEYYDNIARVGSSHPPGVTAVSVTSFFDTPNINFGLLQTGPNITNITPSTGLTGAVVNITNLAGTGFLTGAAVKLTKSGSTDINATSVTVVSSTQITCSFNLTGAAVGQWNVVVTNSDTTFGTLSNGFRVTTIAPTVSTITPNSGFAGTVVNITNLAGTGFLTGAAVKLTKSGSTDINATSVTVASSTQITCSFNLTGAAAGQWNVVVTNTDTQSASLPNGLTVTNPAPTVSGITPNSGLSGTTVNITNLAGTGFLTGAAVKLTKSGSTDINATSVTVASSTQITCSFNLTAAAAGQWNVAVTNSDTQSGTLSNGFTVSNPAPTVSGITPNSGFAGATVNITNLAGTGFLAGAAVKLTKSGSTDINATSVVVSSSTQITCSFNLTGAAAGQWNVVVTNSDTQSGTLSNGFTVSNPAPTVGSITPSTGVTGATVNITNLAGTGFLAGAAVKLTKSGSADINATSVAVTSSTQITCSFNLTGAAAGQWNVVVTNSDNQSGSLPNGFTVSNPATTVSGITPNSGFAGATVNITNLAGTGFLAGAAVKLTKSGSADINATSVAVTSSTQITCSFNLTGAAAGQWNVVVTNTDTQFGALNNGFTVTNIAPTVSGMTPNSGFTGTTVNITNLTGTGFLAGAGVKLTKTGSADINATSVAVTSSTQITCTFDLTGAGTGQWNVRVTNTDNQFGTRNSGFTVTNPAPTVSGMTPNSGVTGTMLNITNLAGTGFLAGAGVKLTKTGSADINATSVAVTSSTQITCTFDLTGAGTGQWNVRVTNTDNQFGTRNSGFTVTNPAPTVSGMTPNSGVTGTMLNITNLAGTGFLAGTTVKLTKSGSADINATSVTVVSPTQITCVFNLAGAATGQWNVLVTNSDAQSGTLNSGFTVTNPAPTVSGMTPNSGVTGTTVNITNLTGTGFLAGAAVKLTKSGSADINATSVTVTSSTQITCSFNLTGATAGQWNMVVTNTDNQSGTRNSGFTVTNPTQEITSITPSTGVTGTTVNITNLAGTGFLARAAVKLTKSGSTDINATSVTVVSPTQITCTFNLTGAVVGQWNVVVTNNNQSGTLNNGFTIMNPPPSITGITPNSWVSGAMVNITNLAGTGFLPGATVKLTKSGSTDINATFVAVVSPTQISCTLNLTGAGIGQWNVVVTNADNQSGTLNSGFTVTNAVPTVNGITPNSWVSGAVVNITNLAGTGFLAGAGVKLTKTGSTDINATSVTVVSSTQITCTFDLTGAAVGQWNVRVTNLDNQFGTRNSGFTVTNPVPTVSGITPNSGGSGTMVNITNLAGTGFLAGATVKLTKSGSTDINATSVAVVSPTQISCTFNLTGAAVGQWNVVVTNTDAQSGTLSSGFAVSLPPPAIMSITPRSGVSGTMVNITNLTGTGFLAGATVKLTKSGSTDINATSVLVVSTTRITCVFNLAGAATGQWDVVVTNTDTQSGTLSTGFAVTNPPPAITSITPNSGVSGAMVNITNLAGTGFLAGATVKLTKSGSTDINATSVLVVSPTQISCTFNLTGAAVGQWNVVVTNTDNQSGTRSNSFAVTNPAPAVSAITPNSGVSGTMINITNLAGTEFLAGATVKLVRSGSTDINATSVTVVSSTRITCVFNLAGAATGQWDVVVTNTDTQSGTLNTGFAVTNPPPAITSITPRLGLTETTVNVTNLAGTGFLAGAAVKLTKSGSTDINATSVTVVSSTQITCTFNLAGAATGQRNVVVTNTDTQSGTRSSGFTVTNPAPTVSGIAPNSGVTETTVNITNLTGTGFLAGAAVKLTKGGSTDINATSVTVVSSTQITCVFNLAGAATGQWNVVVTNADTQSGTRSSGFTVTNPAPTVSSITPSSWVTGTMVNITDLAGTEFLAGATVKLTRSGSADIKATSVTVVSSTQITCVFDLTGATVGQWNVRVTNTDTQFATRSGAFAVTNPAPTVSGITPRSGATETTVNITNLAGTGFFSGATVKLTKSGSADINATSVVVVSSTQITCTFDLTGATVGQWNVRVTNTDTQFATRSGAFAVTN